MSKGGAGRGQGRKPVLTEYERISVGSRCERIWRIKIEDRLREVIAKETSIVRQLWEQANAVPPPDREAWLRSQDGWDYIDDVEFALREQFGISPDDPRPAPRMIQLTAPRPLGTRQSIISIVAAEESAARHKSISNRLVEACWKEYRQMVQEIETSND
jgi:hypothetical protein